MRCFIAVDIDTKILGQVKKLQDDIRSDMGDVKGTIKWVDPERMHLTLKFLGEVQDFDLMEVCNIVASVAKEHSDFSLEVKNVGTFGRPARVAWVGVDENKILENLQKDLEDQFSLAGWKTDNKKFTGHLTLCRIKSFQTGRKIERLIGRYEDFNAGSCDVNSVCVYESELTKTGPVYRLMKKCRLTG